MTANGIRYHVPQSVQEHVDYITPGTRLLEVEGVQKVPSIDKRAFGSGKGVLPPILEPLTLPLSELLDDLLLLCDVAITPACISGMVLSLLV